MNPCRRRLDVIHPRRARRHVDGSNARPYDRNVVERDRGVGDDRVGGKLARCRICRHSRGARDRRRRREFIRAPAGPLPRIARLARRRFAPLRGGTWTYRVKDRSFIVDRRQRRRRWQRSRRRQHGWRGQRRYAVVSRRGRSGRWWWLRSDRDHSVLRGRVVCRLLGCDVRRRGRRTPRRWWRRDGAGRWRRRERGSRRVRVRDRWRGRGPGAARRQRRRVRRVLGARRQLDAGRRCVTGPPWRQGRQSAAACLADAQLIGILGAAERAEPHAQPVPSTRIAPARQARASALISEADREIDLEVTSFETIPKIDSQKGQHDLP